MNTTTTSPTQAELFSETDTETITIPFTKLPSVVEEVREQGKVIVSMVWEP